MQIGNYIEYLDTDAAGNILNTSNKLPCKYNAKAIQSNCFYLNTQLDFGAYNVLGDVHLVSFWHKCYSDTFTANRAFCINLFPLANTTEYFNYWYCGSNDNPTVLTIGNKRVTFSHDYARDYDWHFVEIGWTGSNPLSPDSIVCKIDGVQVTYISETTVNDIGNVYTSQFAQSNSDICNISMYDGNNALIHHYPCAEGWGRILYDTVGNVHATTRSNANTTIWSHTQDFYHYNLTNGYISVDGDDIDRFSKTLKIPLKDASSVLVAKDSYQAGINNYTVMAEGEGWDNYTSSTVTLVKDSTNGNYVKVQVADGVISTTKTLNNCILMTEFNGLLPTTFTSPNLPASYNNFINVNPQIPVQYNFKCKVRCNAHTYGGVDQGTLRFRFYMLHGGTNSFTVNMNPPTDGEWHDIDVTGPVNSDGIYAFANIGRHFCYMQIRNVTANVSVNIDLDIKDIELYRTSNCTYHPPVLNGHNGAETRFDFSQGISDIAEVKNDLLYNYRPGLLETTDESLGANGSMRSNGWSGAMGSSATVLTNGLWSVYYDPTGNSRVGYIDNYTLTDDELAMMGLSSKGVAAQAVQLCCGTSNLENSATTGVALYYRVNLSTLMGQYLFPNVLGWSYKVHFTGWIKKLCEYDLAYLAIGTGYQSCLDADGNHLIPTGSTLLADGQFHYVDKLLSFYAPNYQNSASHLIGIYVQPTGYSSFINPDTGAAYTITEAVHRPAVALAKVKITLEPQEVYFKDGTSFKLMNFNNSNLSKYQSQRQNNQTTFNHD